MSGIGDQGMMPDKVRPQRADDDTMDERVATPPDPEHPEAADDSDDSDEQTDVDAQAAGADAGDSRSQRNP